MWARIAMAPLSLGAMLYGSVAASHAASYTWGMRSRYRLPCRVVSIGNLTVGGTGKTPLTIWMARWYRQQGWRVAVLSRGYGGQLGLGPCVVSTGEGPLYTWSEVGDEPYLLAQELPGVPVIVGKDRFRSGSYAIECFGIDVVILDDGFQHYRLARDLDIVLIDTTNPFGSGALLPRGILRERLPGLQRADAIVLTRVEQDPLATERMCHELRRWVGNRPIYKLGTQVRSVIGESDVGRDFEPLQQQNVVAVVGIGNPQAFAATLTQLGCNVLALLVFPDHHPYTEHDWQAIIDIALCQGAQCLVTTTKDRVRLDPSWMTPVPLYSLHIEVAFAEGADRLQHQLQTLMTYANYCP